MSPTQPGPSQEQRRQRQRAHGPAGHQQPRQHEQRRDPPRPGDRPSPAPALGVRGGDPLQEVFPGDEHTPERAHDRVQRVPGQRRQCRQLRRGPAPASRPRAGVQERLQAADEQRRQQRAAVAAPHRAEQQRQQRRGAQRAHQVVQHPEAVRRVRPGPAAAAAAAASRPGSSGAAPQPRGQRGGTAVRQHHVSQKARPGQRALDQVVGQYAAPRKLAVQRAVKVRHPVDALAAVDAHAGQVHPQRGHRGGIAVQPAGRGEAPRKAVDAGRRRGLHPGLQHGIAPVQRVRQRADQPWAVPGSMRVSASSVTT